MHIHPRQSHRSTRDEPAEGRFRRTAVQYSSASGEVYYVTDDCEIRRTSSSRPGMGSCEGMPRQLEINATNVYVLAGPREQLYAETTLWSVPKVAAMIQVLDVVGRKSGCLSRLPTPSRRLSGSTRPGFARLYAEHDGLRDSSAQSEWADRLLANDDWCGDR